MKIKGWPVEMNGLRRAVIFFMVLVVFCTALSVTAFADKTFQGHVCWTGTETDINGAQVSVNFMGHTQSATTSGFYKFTFAYDRGVPSAVITATYGGKSQTYSTTAMDDVTRHNFYFDPPAPVTVTPTPVPVTVTPAPVTATPGPRTFTPVTPTPTPVPVKYEESTNKTVLLAVLSTSDRSVMFYNASNHTLLKQVQVGNGPVDIIFSLDGDTAYVANMGDSTVSVINTRLNTSDFGDIITTFQTQQKPFKLAENAPYVYVLTLEILPNSTFHYLLYAYNMSTWQWQVVLEYDNIFLGDMVVSRDGQYIYMTELASGSVMKISMGSILNGGPYTLKYIDNMGMPCAGAAMSPDGQYIYVSNWHNDSVSIIDTATDQVIGVIPVGEKVIRVEVDHTGQFLYVLCEGSRLAIVDLASQDVNIVPLSSPDRTYLNIAANPATSYVYAASAMNDRVSEVYGPGHTIEFTYNYSNYYPNDVACAHPIEISTVINPVYDPLSQGNASGYYRLSQEADLYKGWKVQPIPSINAAPGSSEGSPPPAPGSNVELNPQPGASDIHPGVHLAGSEGVLSYNPESALQRKALNPQPVPPGAFDLGKILSDIANYIKNAFGLVR
jgi:YVTN family beta-propeller protein